MNTAAQPRSKTRRFNVYLAINRPDLAVSIGFHEVRGQDADEAVAVAVSAAEAQTTYRGWLLDHCEEQSGQLRPGCR
jgi:hypothetical protein